jgi:hypothetical protein
MENMKAKLQQRREKIYRFEHRLKGDARNEINLDQPSLGGLSIHTMTRPNSETFSILSDTCNVMRP